MTTWKNKFLEPGVIADMEIVFREKFLPYFKNDEDIFFEGYFSENTLFITATLKNFEETFYYPFETSISLHDNPSLKEEEAKLILLDFIGEYFEEYFLSDRQIYIPIDWVAYEYSKNKVYAKAQIINKKLEELADNYLQDKIN